MCKSGGVNIATTAEFEKMCLFARGTRHETDYVRRTETFLLLDGNSSHCSFDCLSNLSRYDRLIVLTGKPFEISAPCFRFETGGARDGFCDARSQRDKWESECVHIDGKVEQYLMRLSGSPSSVSGNMASVRSCVSNLMPETLRTTRSQRAWSWTSGSKRLGYVMAPIDPPRDRRRSDLFEDMDLRTPPPPPLPPFPEATLPVILLPIHCCYRPSSSRSSHLLVLHPSHTRTQLLNSRSANLTSTSVELGANQPMDESTAVRRHTHTILSPPKLRCICSSARVRVQGVRASSSARLRLPLAANTSLIPLPHCHEPVLGN